MSDEQWKSGGQCNECRRNNYCKTECTQHKRRVRYNLEQFVFNKLDERSNGLFSEIIKNSRYKNNY